MLTKTSLGMHSSQIQKFPFFPTWDASFGCSVLRRDTKLVLWSPRNILVLFKLGIIQISQTLQLFKVSFQLSHRPLFLRCCRHVLGAFFKIHGRKRYLALSKGKVIAISARSDPTSLAPWLIRVNSWHAEKGNNWGTHCNQKPTKYLLIFCWSRINKLAKSSHLWGEWKSAKCDSL